MKNTNTILKTIFLASLISLYGGESLLASDSSSDEEDSRSRRHRRSRRDKDNKPGIVGSAFNEAVPWAVSGAVAYKVGTGLGTLAGGPVGAVIGGAAGGAAYGAVSHIRDNGLGGHRPAFNPLNEGHRSAGEWLKQGILPGMGSHRSVGEWLEGKPSRSNSAAPKGKKG